jgi:Glycosyl transferases group 1
VRILFWHVHGSYVTAFVQGRHDYLVPVLPGRDPDGLGRADTWDWPQSVVEVTPAVLRHEDVDVVVLQRPNEIELAADWLGRRPGVDIPAIYLEHNTPDESACLQRHHVADRRDIPIVHVTPFNQLFWDNGDAPTTVIEHGVVDPGHRYTGEIAAGAVVVNEPGRRGRMVGADLVSAIAAAAPIDMFGMGCEDFAATLPLGNHPVRGNQRIRTQDEMQTELARRRVYLHITRWTSLGLSLIEAMHLGMPVIAVAATAAVDAIPPDVGLTSTDIRVLADSLRTLTHEPETAAALGQRAREVALRRYGLARFLADWDEALERVVADHRPADKYVQVAPGLLPVLETGREFV